MPISIKETIALLERVLAHTTEKEMLQPVIDIDTGCTASVFAKVSKAIDDKIYLWTHPLKKGLVKWLSKAKLPNQQESELFQALFILLSGCFGVDHETRINWLGKLLLHNIFSQADIQVYSKNPALASRFSIHSAPSEAVVSEQTDSVANTPHLFAERFPAELRQQVLSFASLESLWNARNVLFSSNVVLLRRRGPEACQMQCDRMREWLSTERGRLQFVDRKKSYDIGQSTFQKMLLDPASNEEHKLCCLMMMSVFYGGKDFRNSKMVHQLIIACKDSLFDKDEVVTRYQNIYLALELLLTTDCLQVDADIELFIQRLFESIIKEKNWPKVEFDDGAKRLCSIPKIQPIIFKICDDALLSDKRNYKFDIILDIMMAIVSETRDPIYLFYFVIHLLEKLNRVIGCNESVRGRQVVVWSCAMVFEALCELSLMFDTMPEGCIEHALKIFTNNLCAKENRGLGLEFLSESLNRLIQKRPEQVIVMVNQLCERHKKDLNLVQYFFEKINFSSLDVGNLEKFVLSVTSGLQDKARSSISSFKLLKSIFTQCPEKLTGVSECVVKTVIGILFDSSEFWSSRVILELLERGFAALPEDGDAANAFVLQLSKALFKSDVLCRKADLLDILRCIFLVLKDRTMLTAATVSEVAQDLVTLCSTKKEFFSDTIAAMKALMFSYPDWTSEIILPVLIQDFSQNGDDLTVDMICYVLGGLALDGCCTKEIFCVFKEVLFQRGQYANSQKVLEVLTNFIQTVWVNQIRCLSDEKMVIMLNFLEEVYIERLEVRQDLLVSDPFFLMLKHIIFTLVEKEPLKGYAFAAQYHDTLLTEGNLSYCLELLSFWYKATPAGSRFFSNAFLENYFNAIVQSENVDDAQKQLMLKAVLRWIRRNPTECLSAKLYESILDFSRSSADLVDEEMRGILNRLTDALDMENSSDLLAIELGVKRFQLNDQDPNIVRSARNSLVSIAECRPDLCLSVGFIQDVLSFLKKETFEEVIAILQPIMIYCEQETVKADDVSKALRVAVQRLLIKEWDLSVGVSNALCRMLMSISVRWYKDFTDSLIKKIKVFLRKIRSLEVYPWDDLKLRAIGHVILSFQTVYSIFDEELFDLLIALYEKLSKNAGFSNIAENGVLLSGFIINCAKHSLASQGQIDEMLSRLKEQLKHCYVYNKQQAIDKVVFCAVGRLTSYFPKQFAGFQVVFHGDLRLQEVILGESLSAVTVVPNKVPAVDDETAETESAALKNRR